MKIFILICVYVAYVAASQELEVPTENNVAKKDDKTPSLLTPPVNDVNKPPNVLEPATTKPLLSSTTPAINTAKSKGKAIRHKKPSHKKLKYRHKGSKDHKRLRPRLPKGPEDLRHRRPKYQHHKSHKKLIHRVPKHIKPNNRHKRINRRHDNDYY